MTGPTNAGPDEPTAEEPTDHERANAGPDEPTTEEPTDHERAAVPATEGAAAVPTAEAAAEEPREEPTGEPTEEPAQEPAREPEPPAVDPVERFRSRHAVPSNGGSRGLWLVAALALIVALGALGATLWVQYRAHWTGFLTTSAKTSTTSAAPPGPSPQQVADAKAKACDAYTTASAAVNVSNKTNPGSEPAAAAVNARLALALAHNYLLERLDPATPPPLADAIRKYADNVEEVTVTTIGGVGTDDPAQADRLKEWGPLNDQITDMCK